MLYPSIQRRILLIALLLLRVISRAFILYRRRDIFIVYYFRYIYIYIFIIRICSIYRDIDL